MVAKENQFIVVFQVDKFIISSANWLDVKWFSS